MKKPNLIFILAIIIMAAVASPAAAFNLPFSTTFNCAEQGQLTSNPNGSRNGSWPQCDGISHGGDQITSTGYGDQITAAANFANGGGGRGHRIFFTSTKNDSSGRLNYNAGTQNELYIRAYTRFMPGVSVGAGWKWIYFSNPSGNVFAYFDIQSGQIRLTIGGQTLHTQPYNTANLFGGSWNCVEYHVKNNGSSGIWQTWINGVLVANYSDIRYGSDFGQFGMPSNMEFNVTGTGYEDTDDVAIQTTGPIGCPYPISGQPQIPNPPANLKVN